jgi:GDPmannose 4,6-dehydratase
MDIERDWGWAPEYVEAMWRMLQQEQPEDFVIATGETNSLKDFVATVFENFGLDWQEHVVSDPTFFRPSDIMTIKANPVRAGELLGWQAQAKMRDVVREMVVEERCG